MYLISVKFINITYVLLFFCKSMYNLGSLVLSSIPKIHQLEKKRGRVREKEKELRIVIMIALKKFARIHRF